jgi:hypothetical protein
MAVLTLLPVDGFAQNRKNSNRKRGADARRAILESRLPRVSRGEPTAPYTAAAVPAESRQRLLATAARMDERVVEVLQREDLHLNAIVDDETFLRRTYLTVAGRIPSLAETRKFLESDAKEKRFELIDTLIASPDYVSHSYNQWASLLRMTDYPKGNIFLIPYREWFKEQIASNRPYDELVYEMLTAEGKVWENPAVGYAIRDFGMPLVHVDNTVRVFLGTQVGCAQCHDHPFDKWSQQDFYKLAAFSHSAKTRDGRGDESFSKGNPVQRLRKEFAKSSDDRRAFGMLNQLVNANLTRVSTDERRTLRLPEDYAYDDAKPKSPVEAQVLWGEIPADKTNASPREQYAAWLTAAENPLFAKTMANRVWKRVMGRALIEPVDNFTDATDGPYMELLDELAAELIASEFDLQHLTRLILYTSTFQREANNFDPNLSEEFHFVGPALQRMTAEQIWDSILTLSISNPFPYQTPDSEDYQKYANLDLKDVDVAMVTAKAKEFRSNVSRQKSRKDMLEFFFRGQLLARASELPQPLPPEHFLQQFGQGDRQTIEGNSQEATMPQALAMFNGPLTHMMLEKGSVVYDEVVEAGDPRLAIDAIFLAVLQRKPTFQQRRLCVAELKDQPAGEAFGNIVWALLNTREFLFIH